MDGMAAQYFLNQRSFVELDESVVSCRRSSSNQCKSLFFFVAVWITIITPLNHLGFSGHVDFCIVTAPGAILKVRDCGNGCFRVKKKIGFIV